MADDHSAAPRPYSREIAAEGNGWYELVSLVGRLTPEERLMPGYYVDPSWTVRDVVAHLGTWLAEVQVQFEQIASGTYEGHDVDIDKLNAAFLEAMSDQPWDVAWVQANAARTRMLEVWYGLPERDDEAGWWIRKSASEHFAEHLGRLREWVDELEALRAAAQRTKPSRCTGAPR